MAITRVGFSASTGTGSTSITMPTGRQVGDLEIMWAFRSGSTTAATVPAGWNTINRPAGATNVAYALCYRWCISASDTSGTWTNATHLICVVYRGVLGIGPFASTANATNTVTFGALTMLQTAGHSWVVGIAGQGTTIGDLSNHSPTGMTLVGGTGPGPQSMVWDTNAGVSSWSTQSFTTLGSAGIECVTLELLADASTWNPYDKTAANLTLSNGNKTATASTAAAEPTVRGSLSRASGKWIYRERVTIGTGVGAGEVGDNGFGNASASLSVDPGGDGNSLSFWNDQTNGHLTFTTGGVDTIVGTTSQIPASPADVFIAIDITNKLAWIRDDAGLWNGSGTANPDAGTGGLSFTAAGPFYPFIGVVGVGATKVFDGAATGNPLSNFTPWDGASGSNVYTASIAESGTASDTIGHTIVALAALAEAGSAADLLAAHLVIPTAVAEAGSAGDTVAAGLLFTATVAESGTAADAVFGSAVFPATVSETGAASDALSSAARFVSALAESGAASDTIASAMTAVASLAEAGSAQDALAPVLVLVASVAEHASAADVLATLMTMGASLAETAEAADALSAAAVVDVDLAEAADADDALAGGLLFSEEVDEDADAEDSLDPAFVFAAAIDELGEAIDALGTGGRVFIVAIDEAGNVVDTVEAYLFRPGRPSGGSASPSVGDQVVSPAPSPTTASPALENRTATPDAGANDVAPSAGDRVVKPSPPDGD